MFRFKIGLAGIVLVSLLAMPSATRGANNVPGSDVSSTIVTGPDSGGGPLVKAFDGDTFGTLHNIIAYAPAFTGGVRVATADVNGDGVADIITGPGSGSGPLVKVFDGNSEAVVQSFLAFD